MFTKRASVAGVVLLTLALCDAAAQSEKRGSARATGKPSAPSSLTAARARLETLPERCTSAPTLVHSLLAEFEKSLPARAVREAQQYAAGSTPGKPADRAWSEYAAAALLSGELAPAAHAGLKAAELRLSGETLTNAGIYLHHAGRSKDALPLLICASDMGFRSAYLLEALAVVHQRLGHGEEARGAIRRAQRAAPSDRIIETESSFIESGKPPPASPRSGKPGLEACLAALAAHSTAVLSRTRAMQTELDRLSGFASRAKAFEGIPTVHQNLIAAIRDAARQVPASGPGAVMAYNSTVAQCVSAYMAFTAWSLDQQYGDSAYAYLYWADALGLDPDAYVRDLQGYEPRGMTPPPSLLSRNVEENFRKGNDAAARQYYKDIDACNKLRDASASNSCRLHARGRECITKGRLIEEWATRRRQRLNRAALSFDNVAQSVVNLAEREVGEAREFAVRALGDLRRGGPQFPGPGGKQMNSVEMSAWQFNESYKIQLLTPHLLAGGKVERFIGEQAQMHQADRELIEASTASERANHQQTCEPVMLELYYERLQEEWQAYLDYLRDRLAWSTEAKAETGEAPCEVGVGPAQLSMDLNKPGEGKLDVKWKPAKGLAVTGSATLRDNQTVGLGIGFSGSRGPVSAKGAISDDLSVSGGVGAAGRAGNVSAGTSGSSYAYEHSYGPFAGKVSVGLTSRRNPYNDREYLGIKLQGWAGLGAKSRGAGVACYPSSGSVTFYPRAFAEDAMRYLSAPASPPQPGR